MRLPKTKRRGSGTHSVSTKSHFILAVDPFVESRYQVNAFHLVKILQHHTHCTIEPVFVLGSSGRGFMLSKDDLQHWLPLTETAFSKLLKKFNSINLAPPKILIQKSPFLRMDVEALVSYAKSKSANAIIAGAQMKGAFERGFLGSFAETLILYSAVPVIAVPPKSKLRNALSPILFPTDFGRESSAAFDRCVTFAKTLGARVVLLHQYSSPHFVYPEGVLKKDDKTWKKVSTKDVPYLGKAKLLEQWKNKAIRSGVQCSTKLTMQSINIADVILSECKSASYGLIAMGATRGPGKAWFTGSTPRWVLRHARYPVWVYYNPVR